MDDRSKMIATLADDFLSVARHRQAHPADTASALMATASAILVADFGERQAIQMMRAVIDESAAVWEAAQIIYTTKH